MCWMRNAAPIVTGIFSLLLLWTTSLTHGVKRGANDDMKLVCYYSNWAIYRPGLAKFTPENINPYLCTHLIYAFAGMNKDYELKPFDSYNDIQQGNYKKFINLKTYNPKLKLLIAVGGWNEGSKRFSKMVELSSTRSRFVRASISFLRKHGFDGLDLDWEYPGFRDGGQDQDKEGYAKLVTELRKAYDSESVPRGKSKLLLTMAVPAGQQYIDKGFDVPVLSKNLDFFNLLTYDYHTAHEPLTNHHSALGETPGLEDWDPNRLLNVKWTVEYYIKKGADRKKLIVGVPTYGRSFTLQDPEEYEIGSPADGPGEKGPATRENGYLAYYEICQNIQDDEWEMEAPHPELMGPYAFKDNQWVGFDDEDIVIEKARYIVQEGLGGGMVWTLDNDDFRGTCYGEQSPLINTLKSALLEEPSSIVTSKVSSAPTTKSLTTQRAPRRQKTEATTPKPAKITTPAPFTTPDPGPPFECQDEGFFNNPVDCKKYFWCLDSGPSNLGLVPHAFTCPSGLFFNKQKDACDYAGNVVCRVKAAVATTTTSKPRPRPRARTTTSTTSKPRSRPRPRTTTTTTTPEPEEKQIPEEIQKELAGLNGPLNDANLNSQSLTELLQLLQKLGINQIHDKLHGRESDESTTTLSATLPEYRSPNRRRPTTTEATDVSSDIFAQYAKPERAGKSDDSAQPTRRPRGPQFHAPSPPLSEDSDELSATLPPDDDEEENSGFPFVYHTPSRHRGTSRPENAKTSRPVEDVKPKPTRVVIEDNVAPKRTQTGGQGHRRVVVRVRPVPGEDRKQNPPGTLLINSDSSSDDSIDGRGNNNYVLAQTIGVRRVARPGGSQQARVTVQEPETTTTTKKPTRVARPRYRPQEKKESIPDFSDAPDISQLVTKIRQSPRPGRYQVTVASGRPAVPATARSYPPRREESKGPGLALLPDGSITCLRRGVFRHPSNCAKFLVCVPPTDRNSDEYDGFIHDCPAGQYFPSDGGRCIPGDKPSCDEPTQR